MKQILEKHATRAGIALAAVAPFAVFGSVLAAPPASGPTFANATVSLDRFGNLECTLRETGLTPGGQVRYDCTSASVGVNTQCMLKNKAVGNSKLLVFHDISAEEVENVDVSKNGAVRAAIITQIPQSETASLTCTAPSEVTVTAVRWCDNSIVDLTNQITGASVPELFANLVPNGSGSVPDCATLSDMPGLPPGE